MEIRGKTNWKCRKARRCRKRGSFCYNRGMRLKFFVIPAAVFLFVTTAPAKDAATGPSPTPSISQLLAHAPAGANTAMFPVPREEWVQRVAGNLDRARKQPGGIPLVFDGDSITDRWQDVAPKLWRERYVKLGAFDFAIGGDRTEHLLWRLVQGQLDGIQPKLVVLMIGTNNLGANTPEEIAAAVTAIVKEYEKRCPKAVILLQAIFPRGQSASDPLRAKIKAVNAIIAQLQDGKKVIYMDFGDKFLEKDGSLSKEIMPDFLHPSEKGYQIWADAIQPVIDQYFPKDGK